MTKLDTSAVQHGLSQHYNASQLRLDTWNRLKDASKQLDSKAQNSKLHERLKDIVESCLDRLEPIEAYWAFPGKDLLLHLRQSYNRSEYQILASTVTYVVRLLSSDLYRSMIGKGSSLEKLGDEAYYNRFEKSKSSNQNKHYFEVLVVDDLNPVEERGFRKRMLELISPDDSLVYNLVLVPSFEDALIAVMLNPNIQSCIVRSSFLKHSSNSLEILEPYLDGLNLDLEQQTEDDLGVQLGKLMKALRPELDLYLVIDSAAEDLASRVYEDFRRVFYRQDDYLELHLSIRRGILERFEAPFFTALKDYSQRPTGVFHAMPLSRGNSIFKSHWIQDMGDFYGKNIFLAETSATTGGLDSLLQPTGPLKKAQELAARAFGSQHTYFVTNGTSTANKIVLQALVQPDDIVMIDRDCHKSHHYGLVLSGAFPVYLDSYPVSDYSMYGAVPLKEIKHKLLELKHAGQLDKVKMLLLTNCTFDGLIYNVERFMEEVLALKPDMIFLWDEAWFAFAGFAPMYRQRSAMYNAKRLHQRYQSKAYRERYEAFKTELAKHQDDETWLLDNHLLPDPDSVRIRVYSTHSTHKKLSSLRQGSMLHIWDEEFKRKVEDSFHEAYMTHTSTSPSYPILASLDLARRQAELEGFELVQKSVEMAMTLRAKIADQPLLQKYFQVLTVTDLIPETYRQSKLERYYDKERGWVRMEEAWRSDEFVLDPTHITLYTGNAGIDGDSFKNKYLMDQFGIQINKTSRNTVLFMTNIGTTRSAIAYLISVLLKIAKQLEQERQDLNTLERKLLDEQVHSLTKELPPLPDFSHFHEAFSPYPGSSAGDMRSAYFMAYDEANYDYLKLDGSLQQALEQGQELVSASFIIPYPPGFPILVPGQVISQDILSFMRALDVKEIHGYRADLGLRIFKAEALERLKAKPLASQSETTSLNGNSKSNPPTSKAKPGLSKRKAKTLETLKGDQ